MSRSVRATDYIIRYAHVISGDLISRTEHLSSLELKEAIRDIELCRFEVEQGLKNLIRERRRLESLLKDKQ